MGAVMERIADALERIAGSLEESDTHQCELDAIASATTEMVGECCGDDAADKQCESWSCCHLLDLAAPALTVAPMPAANEEWEDPGPEFRDDEGGD